MNILLAVGAGIAASYALTALNNKVCMVPANAPGYCTSNLSNIALLGVPALAGYMVTGEMSGALFGLLGTGGMAVLSLRNYW